MNKKKLSKQDRWLMRNWKRACQFEDAMYSARQCYEELFREVHERVRRHYSSLTEWHPHKLADKVTEADWDEGGGWVRFSHPSWLRWGNTWASGLCLWNISLDELAREDAPKLTASIRLTAPKLDGKRLEELRNRLVAKSARLRGRSSIHFRGDDEDDPKACLCFDLPEERRKLLEMVLQDDGQPFIECIANHVEVMARLLKGLDHLLR